MQLSDDPDDWCWVRWLPAVPGARPLPFMHAFGFPLWDDKEGGEPAGPQIHMLPSEYRGQAFPIGDGKDFEGEEEWWQEGLPLDVRHQGDVVQTCGAEAWDTVVGLDAEFDVDEGYKVACYGGEVEGGTFPYYTPGAYTMAGGQVEGGAFPVKVPGVYVMAGGEVEGGAFPVAASLAVSMAGGEVEGGASAAWSSASYRMAGGEAEGGAMPARAGAGVSMAGGECEGGAFPVKTRLALRMAGGEVEGGTFPIKRHDFLRMAGGEAEGGAFVRYYPPVVVHMAGGEVEGGRMGALAGEVVGMAGGEVEGGACGYNVPTVVRMAGGSVEGGAMEVDFMLPGSLILIDKSYSGPAETYAATSAWVEATTKQAITFTLDKAATVLVHASASFINASAGNAVHQLGIDQGGTIVLNTVASVPYVNGYVNSAIIGYLNLAAGTYTLTMKFYCNTGAPSAGLRGLQVYRVYQP